MVVLRVVRRRLVLAAVLGAGLAAAGLASAHAGHHKPSAAVLLDLDPGALVGGDTIVLTGDGGHVLGVHDRPNFILSLGSNERIVGGGENDELGALGQHDTIVAGDAGHELIHGGSHGTVVAGGSGHDLVIDKKPLTTIEVKSPRDEVIVTGHGDDVICSGNSFHDVVYVNHSDAVNNTCHAHRDPVRPESQAVATAASAYRAHASGGPVNYSVAYCTGSSYTCGLGTRGFPFQGKCESGYPICTVFFEPRTLPTLWSSEAVPWYQCPGGPNGYPYLLNATFAPFGTTLPNGVDVNGLGNVGVHIPSAFYGSQGRPEGAAGEGASATSWSTASASYQVVLHCTK